MQSMYFIYRNEWLQWYIFITAMCISVFVVNSRIKSGSQEDWPCLWYCLDLY